MLPLQVLGRTAISLTKPMYLQETMRSRDTQCTEQNAHFCQLLQHTEFYLLLCKHANPTKAYKLGMIRQLGPRQPMRLIRTSDPNNVREREN